MHLVQINSLDSLLSNSIILCFFKKCHKQNEKKLYSTLILKLFLKILHDIKGHIHNLWEALPDVIEDSLKEKLRVTLFECYGTKGKVRGVDYRYCSTKYNN